MARIINKAGTVVSASSDSVGYAVMNLGGNFNSLMQANLGDGEATHAWPVVGYTYFVIRKSHHIAPKDCARRTAAIEYIYRFYRSRTLKIAAESLGFSTVPDFVANVILDYLVNNAMCMSGEYALSAYRMTPSLIMSSPVLSHITKDYIISYTSVDPSANIAYKTTRDTLT